MTPDQMKVEIAVLHAQLSVAMEALHKIDAISRRDAVSAAGQWNRACTVVRSALSALKTADRKD